MKITTGLEIIMERLTNDKNYTDKDIEYIKDGIDYIEYLESHEEAQDEV